MTNASQSEAKQRPPLGAGHIVITLGLLAAQFVLFQVVLFAIFFAVVHTQEACLQATCEDFEWANVATITALGGGIGLFVVTAIIAIWRLATRRRAITVGVTGCVLQLFVIVLALMMLGLAGP